MASLVLRWPSGCLLKSRVQLVGASDRRPPSVSAMLKSRSRSAQVRWAARSEVHCQLLWLHEDQDDDQAAPLREAPCPHLGVGVCAMFCRSCRMASIMLPRRFTTPMADLFRPDPYSVAGVFNTFSAAVAVRYLSSLNKCHIQSQVTLPGS